MPAASEVELAIITWLSLKDLSAKDKKIEKKSNWLDAGDNFVT